MTYAIPMLRRSGFGVRSIRIKGFGVSDVPNPARPFGCSADRQGNQPNFLIKHNSFVSSQPHSSVGHFQRLHSIRPAQVSLHPPKSRNQNNKRTCLLPAVLALAPLQTPPKRMCRDRRRILSVGFRCTLICLPCGYLSQCRGRSYYSECWLI